MVVVVGWGGVGGEKREGERGWDKLTVLVVVKERTWSACIILSSI